MSQPTPNTGPPAPDPLAVALAKLDPAPHGFDREALMFAAGAASKWWVIRWWQVAAGAAAFLAAVFAYLYFSRPV